MCVLAELLTERMESRRWFVVVFVGVITLTAVVVLAVEFLREEDEEA